MITTISLPRKLIRMVRKEAKSNKRTMAKEIQFRLEQTFQAGMVKWADANGAERN